MAMFVAADIGSREDLITDPAIPGPPCFSGANGCFAQVELTGDTIADEVAARLSDAKPIATGAVSGERTEFCAPLENNLFRAAFEAGLFGEREGYTNCLPTGRAGDEVHTSVAVLDVGPELRFIVNPGEAFPGLMLGTPWGIEDASCPARDDPPVPTWHSGAKYRFQVGLGDDLIGYLKQAWSFEYSPPTFTSTDCQTDPHGHSHTLEGESVGPVASNMVAEQLTALLDQNPDPAAEFRLGRYVRVDGTLTAAYSNPLDQGAPGHFPKDAVAIWLADPGSTTLNAAPGPDSGTIVALDGIGCVRREARGRERRVHGLRRRRRAERSGPIDPRHARSVSRRRRREALLRERLSGADGQRLARLRRLECLCAPEGSDTVTRATRARVRSVRRLAQPPARRSTELPVVRAPAAGVEPPHARDARRQRRVRQVDRLGALPGAGQSLADSQ
jgi:hypothetical protein